MKTFCPLPWNGVSIRNNGDLRICCNANSYTKNQGILRKKDGAPYNAGKDDIDESRNSDVLKDVRASMLRGEWHPECERCKQEETSGITSRRQWENMQWNKVEEKVVPLTSADGEIPTDDISIDYFDIRYGNFCNLKCRMCGPTDSHSWYPDYVEAYNTSTFEDSHETIVLSKNQKGRWQTNQYDWYIDSPSFFKQFDKFAKDAKKYMIVGGEPLLIEHHLKSLERLVELGYSKNIKLEYNSNLTNITDKYLDLWKNFDTVYMGASIDGFGDVFEYQRYPANWDTVYKNMLKIETNEDINFICWLAYTITPINVFHLPEFMKWKLTESNLFKFNHLTKLRKIVNQHLCHRPRHYNIKCLPDEVKMLVDAKFDDYISWAHKNQPQSIAREFESILLGVSKFMNSESYYKEEFKKFVDITKKLDIIRNQNIADIVPELEKYFK